MARWSMGCCGVALLAVGCAGTGGPSFESSQGGSPDRGSVVYVDASAPDDGATGSQDHPFPTVEEGVDHACGLSAQPTVEVAPGEYGGPTGGKDPSKDEKDIVVRCPMTIEGATELQYDELGLPTGYDENDPNLTRIRLALTDRQDTIFRVIASDVTISGLVLDGGEGGNLFLYDIDVGGYPQPDDPAAPCPQQTVTGVVIKDSALIGAGSAVESYNADTTITGVFERSNFTGFVLLGGPESEDITSEVGMSRSVGNSLYGGCALPTSVAFFPVCPPAAGDMRPVANHTDIIGNDFSNNGIGGFRQLAVAVGQPDVPATLDMLFAFNSATNNARYGIVSDTPVDIGFGPLTSSIDQYGVYLYNHFGGNGRNAGFIGFKLINQTFNGVPGHYAHDSTTEFDTWPPMPARLFDHDIPPPTDDLNDHAFVDGTELAGLRVSPPHSR